MADRTFLWGGKSPPRRRATEFGGRRRHDQQRLLVELELDDSMYQGTLRAGMQQTATWQSEAPSSRRTTYTRDLNNSRSLQPGNEQDFSAEPKPRLQTRAARESAAKPLTERQMQQLQARRLSSPYKLKQQVQGTRSDAAPHRYQQSPHNSNANSVQRATRSPPLQQSPAQIVIDSIRQNMHLRDQVMAHLQQELMGVLPLHRASHVEKNVPQRVVKLLNRMRSLALAVVEAVVYLSSELGGSDVVGVSAEHEILEQDFYGYLLQMASSDSDFLACSPPLQRFFEDFEVSLTRNPFVDGLSLDSSEVLLCSCHQSSTSGALFCSASSSSTSLLRLLTHKLETFALQTQRYLQGWQILPAERVAAALLHLMDLETRYNAVRMIPRYLQSHGEHRRHLHQHRVPENVSYGYGTFEDERIQRLDRQGSRLAYTGGRDTSQSEKTVVEAWAGSPTSKTVAKLDARPPTERSLTPTVPDQLLPSTTSSASVRRPSKNENARSATPPTSAWTPISSPPDSGFTGKENTILDSAASPVSDIHRFARKMSARTVDTGIGGEDDTVELTRLVLPLPPLDTAALAKSSSRSTHSERPASKKRSSNSEDKCDHRCTFVDVGMQMSEPAAASGKDEIPMTKRSASTLSARSSRDETMQVYEEGPGNLVSVRRPSVPVVTKDQPQREVDNLDIVSGPIITEVDFSESVEEGGHSIEQLTSSRNTMDNWMNVEAALITETESSVEYDAENDAELNDDGYECDFEYSSNEALSSIAMALQMLPSFSFSESALTDEVLKPEEAIPPNAAESLDSSRAEELEADHVESEVLPAMAAILSSAGVSPAPTNRSMQSEAIVSMESITCETKSVEQRTEVATPDDDEYAYSSSSAVSNIAMALSLLPSVWNDDAFAIPEEESEHPTESHEGLDSPRINSYRSIDEAQSPFENAVHLSSSVDDTAAYFSLSSFRSSVASDPVMHSFPAASRTSTLITTIDQVAYSSPPSSCYGAPSMASGDVVLSSSRSNASTMIRDDAIPSLPASSRTDDARTATGERAAYSSPTSSRSDAPTMISDQVMNSTPASSRSNPRVVVIGQAAHSPFPSSRSNISASSSYQGDDESEPSEFNRIFSLCRDIQVAAFDMSHWVSQREVEDHILSVAQPYSSLMGYASPTIPVGNAPKYLERELKMLRRNFTYWKEACAEQKRAKQVVRRAVAWRKIKKFIYCHHQRRLQARRDEDHRVRSIAACRIQRNWRIYLHNQEVARRKVVFRLIHMRFYRMLFFVSISLRQRQREYAKEKVVRWWRHQRSKVKKKKQRREKLVRERERRARALKDIQRFLMEILLRRKLKAAQELTKNIMFKEQLKWTKAKRDVEKTMKLNSKHRRELIADMDARLAELDRRWKASEEERLQLLTHHERVVQLQQHAVEVRRSRLAAMKIQMFFRVCLLHKKLQRVEVEKKQYALKLQKELLAKEKLGIETQKRVHKTRTQVRVLERKLDRMAQQALQSDARHRKIVQAHQKRERVSEENAARQKIKGFIDARVLSRKAESEKHQLLMKQAHLQAEKMEIELMSCEDQLEQRRTATTLALELQRRLSELEARSEALLQAKDQLAAEKQLEAQRAAAFLEHSRVEAGMQVIASWVSGQMQLSKLKKEKAAICASAVHEMEEEKRRQREEIEAKTHEVALIKASSFMHQRISQHRNNRTVGMIRMQQKEKSAQDKLIAEQTRAQLVQVIIAVKLLAECESSKGVSLALDTVARFHKELEHKSTRLKYLRCMNCARKVQRACRRWTHHQRIKRAQELALAQLEENKQRQALARRLQAWWRKWTQEQQRRREQQRIFNAHLEMIRVRANARRIQCVWRRWVIRERERRREQQLLFNARLESIRVQANIRKIQSVWRRWITRERERRQLAFNAHLRAIRMRANARKIQGVWKRWVIRERERRNQQQQAFKMHLETIRARTSARKIQGAWRRWVVRERERRHQQQLLFDARLEAIRARANVRKIQGIWRRWVIREREQKCAQQLAFDMHLEALRTRANVRKIQAVWRRWVIRDRERRNEQRRVFNARLETIRTRANVCKIQSAWRRWVKRERDRRYHQQQMFDAHLEAIRVRANVRKVQAVWRRWVERKQEEREVQRVVFSSVLRIQRWWRKRQQQQRAKAERIRILREASAQMIQRRWLRWQQWQRAEEENKRLRIQRQASARKIQKCWRQWRELTIRRDLSAKRIQKHWEKWQKEKEEVKRVQMLSITLIQRNWRKWQCKENLQLSSARIQRACYRWWQRRSMERNTELEHHKDEQLQQEYLVQTQNASSLKIQRNWGNRQHRRKMERELIQHEQHMSALKIQTLWLKWHHEQQEELERDRIRQEQYESSLKIQRSWGISQRRQKVAHERLRHKQNLSALKIQKHWRRRRHLCLEQRHRKKSNDAELKTRRTSLTVELKAEGVPGSKPDAEQLQHIEQERQQQLDAIKYRSYGRRIARAVNKYHQNRRENSAATRIEAIWKGKLCRMQYLADLEVQRAEEARQYRLMVSVFASKVQTCWRRWITGVRQMKRAVVKDDELRLIQEVKDIERKVLVAKRSFAAKRIQRAIVSRRKLQDAPGDVVITNEKVLKHEEPTEKARDKEPIDSLEDNEPVCDLLEPIETTEEDTTRADVDSTVEDWSHRELPHILTRSVNQILFYHDAARVLQKVVREYQKRQRMYFYCQRSLATTTGNLDGEMSGNCFHFYFKRASAWLAWERSKSNTPAGARMDSKQVLPPLRLRFDSQMTRKLLQLFEPSDEYLASEIQHILQELTTDALPILKSPVCLQDNDNVRLELCYHDVDEMELSRSVALLRQMGQRRAQIRRQQLLEIDTSVQNAPATLASPIAKSTPSSPSKKEVTIFTAVENASVEDATFLQQRGADIAAVEPKMQRSVLHMLSFSKENYRSRAEMLEFLLACGANLNVNAVDCNGDTPLMLYASLGHLDFMQKLLAHGADVQATNRKGQNVLHRACEDDQVEICGFLQQLMMKDSIAENVIPIETISALVPAALSLHTPDNAGRYPVHCLAERGFVECTKQLVVPTEVNYEWNCMLQAQGNSQGRTALHLAVLTHDTAMTAFLLTPGGGSNANAFDDLHRSPVHYAVESPAALSIIARLVQHGANLNAADERRDTPLHWAAFSGRAAVAQNLLALGADPTLVNSDWETPAQIAAAYGQLDCMRLLLQGQRRFGAASTGESKEQHQQQPALARPASAKTALQRLEEAVNHLHEKQAADNDEDTNLEIADGDNEAATGAPLAQQSHGGYWEELHQDVQLVEESGQFSSEDEEDLLFGHHDDF